MADVEKPTTMLMEEFKEKFVQLLNEAQLPAWVLLYLIEPYVEQLRQMKEAVEEEEKRNYEAAIKGEQNGAD